MEIEDAIRKLLDGDAILFAGAGCSAGALNLRSKPFLQGRQLTQHFANLSGIAHTVSLEDASEMFLDKYGPSKLIEELKYEFTAKTIAAQHKSLGRMPWKRLYTTNYDNVLEEAFRVNSKPLVTITTSDNPRQLPKNQVLCIHLNGFIERLNTENIGTELKLIESSYLSAQLAESPWASVFRQDIRFAQAVFFIGYSVRDLEIKRILIELPTLQEKSIFILGKSPDDTTKLRAKKFGTAFEISVNDFCELVDEIRKVHTPVLKSLSTLSIREHTSAQSGAEITDRNFSDLLLFGRRDPSMIFESIKSGKRYLLERNATTEVFRLIGEGKSMIILSSDLGNGKSLLLDGLRFRALERGFRVFEVREHNDEAAVELDKISKLGEKVFVTIEEYQDWLTEIQNFKVSADDGSVLILTARNAINDVMYDNLLRQLGLDYIPDIRLDILKDNEIEWFIQALDEYGLWGKRAAQKRADKYNYIRVKCHAQIHALLLDLMDSPDIAQRLHHIADTLVEHKEKYKILLGVCILTLLNQIVTMESLADIFGLGQWLNRTQRDSTVKEFLDFTRSEIIVRSPIAAEYILTRIADPAFVVSILSDMAHRVHTAASSSKFYNGMFKNFIRYSSLQMVLPKRGPKTAFIITYYESLKNLSRCKTNPLFWLQYAIASLIFKDLFHSRRYFETAYSYSEELGFDTYQIDNHYARFLLVEAIEGGLDISSAMENFRQAHTIISRQITNEKLYYPYKVAANYLPFFNRFRNDFSSSQMDEIAASVVYVSNMINRLSIEKVGHKNIIRCDRNLKQLLNSIKLAKNENTNLSNEISD